MLRIGLHSIKPDKNLPGPIVTRVETLSLFNGKFIGGENHSLVELEHLVKELKGDLDDILKKGKKIYKP